MHDWRWKAKFLDGLIAGAYPEAKPVLLFRLIQERLDRDFACVQFNIPIQRVISSHSSQ